MPLQEQYLTDIFSGRTRYVRKVMRLIRENSFNWRYVYTHLIFFKITSLSIVTVTPLPAVLPRVVARLEILNWDFFHSIRHAACTFITVPKWCPFKLDLSRGNKKKSGGTAKVWAAGCRDECSERNPSSRLPGELRRVAEPLAMVYWC